MIRQDEYFFYADNPVSKPPLRLGYKMGQTEQEINQIRYEGRQEVASYNLLNPKHETII